MLENVMQYFEMIHPAIQFILFWSLVILVVLACIRVLKWLKRIVVDWFYRTFGKTLCKYNFHDYSHSRSVMHHDLDQHYEKCSRCDDERSIPHW